MYHTKENKIIPIALNPFRNNIQTRSEVCFFKEKTDKKLNQKIFLNLAKRTHFICLCK